MLGMRDEPVLGTFSSIRMNCGKISVSEVLIPKLMPKSWSPWVEQDSKVNDFDFFSALVSGCHILSVV